MEAALYGFWLQHAPVLSVLLPSFTAVVLLLLGDSSGSAGQGGTRLDTRLRWRRAVALGSVSREGPAHSPASAGGHS